MRLFDQEDNYFGLDLGSNAIKLAQVRELHGSPSLITYGDIETPANMLSSDSEIDQNRLSDLIKQLAEDARVTSKNVVAGLPASSTYTSVIKVPKLKDEELAQSIRFQADKYIPMAIDQVKLDWIVVGEDVENDEQEVLLVAAPISTATKYLNIIQKAGFELLSLEINPLAQARSLVSIKNPDSCVVILDMGVNNTDLSVIDKGVPRLVRSVSVGSRSFRRMISQNLGLDDTQADQFMKKFGMMEGKLDNQVISSMKPLVDNLIEETKKSISFYQEKNKDRNVEKVIITGGTSALPELPMYLANNIGVTVEIGNPWQNVSYPAEIQQQLAGLALNYATALGLALRNFV